MESRVALVRPSGHPHVEIDSPRAIPLVVKPLPPLLGILGPTDRDVVARDVRQGFIARAVECIPELRRQRTNTNLNVDNVLRRQPWHRRGTYVVDAKREAPALCARMSETVPPPEITEEGETGRRGHGPAR